MTTNAPETSHDREPKVLGVSISEVDPSGKEPSVIRAWLPVSAEHIEAITALLGEPDETSIYSEQAQSTALDAYEKSVRL